MLSQSSVDSSARLRRGTFTPALFTRMSNGPSLSFDQSKSLATSASTATSQAWNNIGGSPLYSAAACFSFASRRPAIATRQPSWARPKAIPRPIPVPPPVTNAVLPASRIVFTLSKPSCRADIFEVAQVVVDAGEIQNAAQAAQGNAHAVGAAEAAELPAPFDVWFQIEEYAWNAASVEYLVQLGNVFTEVGQDR